MIESKKIIRQRIKSQLSTMSMEEHEILSGKIAENLFSLEEWKKANTIGMTISIPPEIPTEKIIEQAWREGKAVAIPKCRPDEKTMVFKKITSFNQLESVYYGLLEPTEETKKVSPGEMDTLIVPGLAFSKQGYRLGFGGGYYDRFLSNYRGNTLALSYDIQVIDDLPVEVHDVAVGKLITPTKILRTYSH